jgi:hypothetical protein
MLKRCFRLGRIVGFAALEGLTEIVRGMMTLANELAHIAKIAILKLEEQRLHCISIYAS